MRARAFSLVLPFVCLLPAALLAQDETDSSDTPSESEPPSAAPPSEEAPPDGAPAPSGAVPAPGTPAPPSSSPPSAPVPASTVPKAAETAPTPIGAPGAPEGPPTASPPAAGKTGQDYRALLELFSARIEEIEGKILLAKEKVDVLRDTVLTGAVSRSKAVIVHHNDMGGSFVLEQATYVLDGGVIFSKDNADGVLDRQKEFEVFNGAIATGEHEISVAMTYGGSSYGFFTYLKGYKFKVESKYRFNVLEGRLAKLTVVSYAKGDITASASERLAVRYDLDVGPATSETKTTEHPGAKPPAPGGSTGAPGAAPPAPTGPAQPEPGSGSGGR